MTSKLDFEARAGGLNQHLTLKFHQKKYHCKQIFVTLVVTISVALIWATSDLKNIHNYFEFVTKIPAKEFTSETFEWTSVKAHLSIHRVLQAHIFIDNPLIFIGFSSMF